MNEPIAEAYHWQPDEIAECTDVCRATYSELWGLVCHYDNAPRGETPGEMLGEYAVTKYWSELTPAAQIDVNQALAVICRGVDQ